MAFSYKDYVSPYKQKLDELSGTLMGFDKIYNPETDVSFTTERNRINKQAQALSEAAKARLAQRSGAISTTQAVAAQQAINKGVNTANDLIPQFKQNAYNKYLNNYTLMKSNEAENYAKYLNDRNYAKGQYEDALNEELARIKAAAPVYVKGPSKADYKQEFEQDFANKQAKANVDNYVSFIKQRQPKYANTNGATTRAYRDLFFNLIDSGLSGDEVDYYMTETLNKAGQSQEFKDRILKEIDRLGRNG